MEWKIRCSLLKAIPIRSPSFMRIHAYLILILSLIHPLLSCVYNALQTHHKWPGGLTHMMQYAYKVWEDWKLAEDLRALPVNWNKNNHLHLDSTTWSHILEHHIHKHSWITVILKKNLFLKSMRRRQSITRWICYKTQDMIHTLISSSFINAKPMFV